jgi:polyisoprenoid-binding protein YceI
MESIVKVVGLALLGLIGVLGLVAYSVFKPPAVATDPIEAVAVENDAASESGGLNARRFEIQPGHSEARFVIDEVLRGEPKTVVGTTDQVAGQIVLDPQRADASQVGTILINARTFETDSDQRDRAIQNRILQTDAYEYISFTPTSLVGLPSTLREGVPASFQVTGDLKIRDVTRPVTFDATVTPASSDRLEGTATTTVRYADWGLSIPQVPSVAGVTEQLELRLNFVATVA